MMRTMLTVFVCLNLFGVYRHFGWFALFPAIAACVCAYVRGLYAGDEQCRVR